MESVPEPLWSDILGRVQHRQDGLGRPWFCTLELGDFAHGVLEVRAHTLEQHQYLQEECAAAFTEAAQEATGRLVSIRFSLSPDGPASRWVDAPSSEPAASTNERIILNGEYTFENFVTGPCNRLAHAACVAVSESPGRAYNPLFLHGSVGLGKTHLLQAVCHRLPARAPSLQVLYLSCETFTNHFIEAVEKGALHTFRYRYRHVDALIIDDIQFLAARERSQEEFFHTFNTLYQMQRQIILSADSPPKEIPSLEDRLVSRFNWGLVARIDPPCLETRMAILRKKAKLRSVDLPEPVVHLIASRINTNTRELEGAIIKVTALSQQYGSEVTEEIALEALGDTAAGLRSGVSLQEIADSVTHHFGVKLTDLQSKKRHKSIALPRQVCMFLAREMTRMSLEEIGGHFGGRDHTTVLHAYRTISAQQQSDSRMAQTLQALRSQLDRRHS